MLYCCEVCGKKHTSEEKALECERVHAEEKIRREELTKEKEIRVKDIEKSIKTLESDIEKFYKDYGTYPNVSIKIYSNPLIPSAFQYLFR